MLTLKDPILTERPASVGIELPPLREPESLQTSPSYVPSARGTTMTSKELAEVRSPALSPEPGFDKFGERALRMTQPLRGSFEGNWPEEWFRLTDPPPDRPLSAPSASREGSLSSSDKEMAWWQIEPESVCLTHASPRP
jgi:hypothetical protein